MDKGPLTKLYRQHLQVLTDAYAKALGANGFDAVMLHGGRPQLKTVFDDNYWPLRVTPHFQHWLPLAEPDCALLVRPGKKPTLYRNVEENYWEAPSPPESDHFWGEFEVVDVADPAKLGQLLPKEGRTAFIGEDRGRAAAWGFAESATNPQPLTTELDRLRTTKTAYEIVCLKEANERAARGHRAVAKAFRGDDHSELDLHLLYLKATKQDDPETPYKNIVALGEHAATLHHVGYGRKASKAQALLLDAGATCLGYASDVTRTMVKGKGAAASSFAQLVKGMETLQQEMCRRVKTGVPYEQLHNESHQLLAGVLRDVGIASASEQELVDSGVTRKFLPHGLGHSLGLQTHDVGCAQIKPEARNPYLRNTSKVTAGQVFTIEPGCYFIGTLMERLQASPEGKSVDWKLVDALTAFGGVRIEDDLFVREGKKAENLTREVLA